MPHDNWVVEEEITPGPDLDIRAVYIGLLQQVIDALKEQYVPGTVSKMPPTSFEAVAEEMLSGPIFDVPTVIFAYLDTESRVEGYEKGERALVQLFCYRDRREFLKDLISYGDEDYIKELGLSTFVAGKDKPQTTP